jgi:hypothetical protein
VEQGNAAVRRSGSGLCVSAATLASSRRYKPTINRVQRRKLVSVFAVGAVALGLPGFVASAAANSPGTLEAEAG